MMVTFWQSGDKVQVITDLYDSVDVAMIVIVPRNSVGTILSFEEYCSYIDKINRLKTDEHFAEHCLVIEKEIQEGKYLPIRIDEFAPLSDNLQDFWSKNGFYGKVYFEPQSVVLVSVEQLVNVT